MHIMKTERRYCNWRQPWKQGCTNDACLCVARGKPTDDSTDYTAGICFGHKIAPAAPPMVFSRRPRGREFFSFVATVATTCVVSAREGYYLTARSRVKRRQTLPSGPAERSSSPSHHRRHEGEGAVCVPC